MNIVSVISVLIIISTIVARVDTGRLCRRCRPREDVTRRTSRACIHQPFLRIFLVLFSKIFYIFACPDGWIKHGDSCYFFSHDKEGWTEALTLCKLFGGFLVEIDSVAENDYLASQSTLYGHKYYIGLTDIVEEGVWQWIESGTLLAQSSFAKWGPNEPNNLHGEDCGIIYGNGNWNDGLCHNPENYICELPDEYASKSCSFFSLIPIIVNSIPNENLDWSRLKAFAGNEIKVTEKLKLVFGMVEKFVGKGESAGY